MLQIAEVVSGNISRFCRRDSTMFSTLPARLSQQFQPLRQQFCAVNFTRLQAELAGVSGYDRIYNIVCTTQSYQLKTRQFIFLV